MAAVGKITVDETEKGTARMPDPYEAAIIAFTFLLAGTVKGVIGLGLPTVSLGILAAALDLTTAIAVLIIPAFITNVWQAVTGGNGLRIVRRIWPFLCAAFIPIAFSAAALKMFASAYLTMFLGVLLGAYAMLNLVGFRLSISERQALWAGPVLGAINGLFAGMTGSFGVPGIMYLQAIGLGRDMLVQAMGMLFALSTIGLAIGLGRNDLLSSYLTMVSAAAVIPAVCGMMLGQRIRRFLPDATFRTAFFGGVLGLGLFILVKSIAALMG